MANQQFPIKITPRGSSNRRIIQALKSGRISYPMGLTYWTKYVVRFGAGDFAPAAATTQTLDLNTVYPNQAIPVDVFRLPGTFLRAYDPIAGGTIADSDAEVGEDGGANDSLLTISNIASIDIVDSTPGATDNDGRTEETFAPSFTVMLAGGNVDAAVSGRIGVFIPYLKLPS